MADLVAGADASAGGGAPRADRASREERAASVLGVFAGVLYNSWPLAFVLDRPGLRGTYLSVLEMPGRPHAHVFVALDLAAGAAAVAAGLLLRRHRPAAVGLVMFGIGNALEASIPIGASCAPSVASCGIAPGQVLAPHDIASILSVAGLVVALWSLRRHSRWMTAVCLLTAGTGLFLGLSVVAVRWVTVSQISFLVGCGVALGAVPLACARRRRAGRDRPRGLRWPATGSGSARPRSGTPT